MTCHCSSTPYVKFLRDVSVAEAELTKPEIDRWFRFPEVKQNWLGFSRTGNRGSGLGADFANGLHRNLRRMFSEFGTETITRGSHLEKLCLVSDGVGRDHLSDFTTNLIKRFLLEYTQAFARKHLDPAKLKAFAIQKVTFDYETRRWRGGKFDLPAVGKDFVLLTPKDVLTRDEAWINRDDLLNSFEEIYVAVPDEQLRYQVGEYLRQRLKGDATSKEVRQVRVSALEAYPELLDHYIKSKEEDGAAAHKVSSVKVQETHDWFVQQVHALVAERLAGTEFYELGDSFDEALKRVTFLKDVIENKDGYRLFYVKGKPIQREVDLQILFRLTWCGSPYDVNREVNNGRGPVDFKISRGSKDATLVEFKLASNSQIRRNLEKQVAVYEAASDTSKSIKAILFFSDQELLKVRGILKDLGLEGRRDVVLIDARADNKPSASKA
jgi:hypothetical protein